MKKTRKFLLDIFQIGISVLLFSLTIQFFTLEKEICFDGDLLGSFWLNSFLATTGIILLYFTTLLLKKFFSETATLFTSYLWLIILAISFLFTIVSSILILFVFSEIFQTVVTIFFIKLSATATILVNANFVIKIVKKRKKEEKRKIPLSCFPFTSKDKA
ncbi:MAG: hypothetical protein ACOYMB_00930 [Patescibacteria group bacterium]